jgi:predicted DNA-binding transcriptional regulator AlpA
MTLDRFYDKDGERLWTAEEVANAASITLRTFHNYYQTGRAPRPDSRIGRTPVWLDSTVDAWLVERHPSYQRQG